MAYVYVEIATRPTFKRFIMTMWYQFSHPTSKVVMFADGKPRWLGRGIWYTCRKAPNLVTRQAMKRQAKRRGPGLGRKMSPSKARFERRRRNKVLAS